MKTLTENTVNQSTKGVRTMVFGVPDKNKVEFPKELLVPGIELTLALCHVPPLEGEPWRQYAVFVVIHAGQEQTAMLR